MYHATLVKGYSFAKRQDTNRSKRTRVFVREASLEERDGVAALRDEVLVDRIRRVRGQRKDLRGIAADLFLESVSSQLLFVFSRRSKVRKFTGGGRGRSRCRWARVGAPSARRQRPVFEHSPKGGQLLSLSLSVLSPSKTRIPVREREGGRGREGVAGGACEHGVVAQERDGERRRQRRLARVGNAELFSRAPELFRIGSPHTRCGLPVPFIPTDRIAFRFVLMHMKGSLECVLGLSTETLECVFRELRE